MKIEGATNKIASSLGACALILASFGAGCSATTGTSGTMAPNPSSTNAAMETVKNVTYENSSLGFSLAHPSDWRTDESATGTVNFFYAGTGGEPAVTVERLAQARDAAFQARVAKLTASEIASKGKTTVNGTEAQSVCLKSITGEFCEYYFMQGAAKTLKAVDYGTGTVSGTLKILK